MHITKHEIIMRTLNKIAVNTMPYIQTDTQNLLFTRTVDQRDKESYMNKAKNKKQ